MDFQTIGGVLSAALFLALAVERFVQFVVKPLLTAVLSEEIVGRVIPYVTAILGGLASWGFGVDLFGVIAEMIGLSPAAWVTQLMTALVVSGGSNLLNDLWPGSRPSAAVAVPHYTLEFVDEGEELDGE